MGGGGASSSMGFHSALQWGFNQLAIKTAEYYANKNAPKANTLAQPISPAPDVSSTGIPAPPPAQVVVQPNTNRTSNLDIQAVANRNTKRAVGQQSQAATLLAAASSDTNTLTGI